MRKRCFSTIFSRILPRTGTILISRYGDEFARSLPDLSNVTITKDFQIVGKYDRRRVAFIFMSKINYYFVDRFWITLLVIRP